MVKATVCTQNPYAGKRIYGPYTRKDGRQHIVAYSGSPMNWTRTTVSYPKFLMEIALGRLLDPVTETIDHIDGNWMNNDPSNLRIVPLNEHARDDSIVLILSKMACVFCGKDVPEERLRWAHTNRYRLKKISGPFCSKQCSGKYGALRQKGYPKLLSVDIPIKYVKYKSIDSE